MKFFTLTILFITLQISYCIESTSPSIFFSNRNFFTKAICQLKQINLSALPGTIGRSVLQTTKAILLRTVCTHPKKIISATAIGAISLSLWLARKKITDWSMRKKVVEFMLAVSLAQNIFSGVTLAAKLGANLTNHIYGGIPIQSCIRDNNLAMARHLIELGAQPTITDFEYAVRCSNIPFVQYLLDHCPELDREFHVDGYCLCIAIARGNISMLHFLVEHGANVNNNCPLHAAVHYGTLEAAQYLIDHGASVDGDGEYSPIQLAIELAIETGKEDKENMVRFLIEHGASPDKIDLYAACLEAARKGHHNIHRYLVDLRDQRIERERAREQERLRKEAEERKRRQREQDRTWLADHTLSMHNLQVTNWSHFCNQLEGIQARIYDQNAKHAQELRWQAVCTYLENPLPSAMRERLERMGAKCRYKRLSLLFHPDKVQADHPELRPFAERIFKVLNASYSAVA